MVTTAKCQQCAHKGLCMYEGAYRSLEANVRRMTESASKNMGTGSDIFTSCVDCKRFLQVTPAFRGSTKE